MAIQIILLILVIPIIIGFWIPATRVFIEKFEHLFVLIAGVAEHIRELRFLPARVKYEIEVRKEIVKTEKYFDTQRDKDIISMSSPEGFRSTEALARRLSVTDHQRKHSWIVKPERPPMWIRYIIAQVVRK